MQVKTNAIIPLTPAADQSDKEGFFVELTDGKASVCNSATDIPLGVILDGEVVSGVTSVAVAGGFAGTCKVKLGGNVAKGAFLQLTATGTVITDAGTGARVIVARALEAGTTDELIEAVLLQPVAHAAE
jgi:hypothetical protein